MLWDRSVICVGLKFIVLRGSCFRSVHSSQCSGCTSVFSLVYRCCFWRGSLSSWDLRNVGFYKFAFKHTNNMLYKRNKNCRVRYQHIGISVGRSYFKTLVDESRKPKAAIFAWICKKARSSFPCVCLWCTVPWVLDTAQEDDWQTCTYACMKRLIGNKDVGSVLFPLPCRL